ncbi:hypothetical protein [Candidatus Spongiihabitans sp.]|uniref:hypothetical protein n=1 Tax=Candidatus Spongiihabitans sp. TaxID=3101308 RepID=UPI003C6FA113
MTLDKARKLLKVQVDFGGSYNRHSAQLILAEVVREHGRKAADDLIVDLELNRVFDFVVGGDL